MNAQKNYHNRAKIAVMVFVAILVLTLFYRSSIFISRDNAVRLLLRSIAPSVLMELTDTGSLPAGNGDFYALPDIQDIISTHSNPALQIYYIKLDDSSFLLLESGVNGIFDVNVHYLVSSSIYNRSVWVNSDDIALLVHRRSGTPRFEFIN